MCPACARWLAITTGTRHSDAPFPDRTPIGYERFWSRFPPPQSAQPIDTTKRGGARYDHVKDIDDWRLVFVDTGPCNDEDWPVGDPDRPLASPRPHRHAGPRENRLRAP